MALTSGSGSRYRFLSRIATGGMAELYLGEATGIGGVTKRVALKRILPGHASDKDYLEMFLEEARLASTLQHPNIVQTYDVIRSNEEYVMVMEYLEGSDLYQFRRRLRTSNQTMPMQYILHIATSVLGGLHYAHERTKTDGRPLGIVHRDVSPQNIFLTYDGGVKLLDFGIAKADAGTAVSKTESGVLKGKVLYMSPEQCSGRDVDRRADIYAVGVVLYQLLTWSMPHRGKNAYDTMRSIIDDPVPRPSLLNPSISPALEQIVMTALAKSPADRYPTARDMQAGIERYAAESGLFVSSTAFSSFIESVIGGRPAPTATPPMIVGSGRSMPKDISVPASSSTNSGISRPAAPEQVLFESPQVVLRRLAGIQVLSLSGVIDERFDATRAGSLLKGEVVVDTHDVSRITSFGIRHLTTVFKEARPRITGLYHVRCSVAFVNQVTMMRSLLGGGRILSFALPYLDAQTNASFVTVLRGEDAATAIQTQQPPKIPSPSDPKRYADFDEDPEVYFNFAEDFLAEPPQHLSAALRMLEERERRLEIELVVGEAGTTLHVRRPLRVDDRWQRVVDGLEGAITLDLSEVAMSDDGGVRALVRALEEVADEIRAVRIVGGPLKVCAAFGVSGPLQAMTSIESVQVFGRCSSCETERRMILTPAELQSAQAARIPHTCAKCGGTVVVNPEFTEPGSIGPLPTLAKPNGTDPRVARSSHSSSAPRAISSTAPPAAKHTTGRQSAPRSHAPESRTSPRATNPRVSNPRLTNPRIGAAAPDAVALPVPADDPSGRLRTQIGCLLLVGIVFALSAAGAVAGLFLRLALAGG